MPPAKKDPEKPQEIEDVDQWNAIVSKDNLDLNVVDVYAEWCGPCMCESPSAEFVSATVICVLAARASARAGGGSSPFSEDLNVLTSPVSLRARAGLGQTYKRILFDNDEMLVAAMEAEGKTIKYWNACTEKLGAAAEEGAPVVEGLEAYAGDPMPHLLIYLKGDLKATINVSQPPPKALANRSGKYTVANGARAERRAPARPPLSARAARC